MRSFVKLAALVGVVAFAGCGDDEVKGADGVGSLISTSAEPAGDNCPNGGVRLDVGLDTDGDGVLGSEEIVDTQFSCSGSDGSDGEGFLTLVSTSAEPAGANCAEGGQRVDFGIDDNGDGVLDSVEVDGTTFVCNGITGGDGLTSLIATATEAPGANCVAGGIRIDAGTDTSDDGVLDAGEITSTNFACNGLQSLVVSSFVAAGGACGDLAGSQMDMGLDLNNDGTLQAGEITASALVCNGTDGSDGANGFEALVNQTPIAAGGACGTATGVQIDSGIDADRSGVLEAGEIANTSVLCNGVDGANGAPGDVGLTSLILLTAESAGANCAAGGTRIDSGVDSDGSGVLEAGEITDTGFACNGVAPVAGCTVDPTVFPSANIHANNFFGEIAFASNCDILATGALTTDDVYQVSAVDGTVSVLSTLTGAGFLNGVLYRQSDDTIYVAAVSPNEIWSVDNAGVSVIVMPLPATMNAVALAPAGFGAFSDLIIGAGSDGNVYAIDPVATTTTIIGTTAGNLSDLAFAPDGTLFIANNGGTIQTMTSAGVFADFLTGLTSPDGIAVAADGSRLFVAHFPAGARIDEVSIPGAVLTVGQATTLDGGSFTTGLLVDGLNTVLVKTSVASNAVIGALAF